MEGFLINHLKFPLSHFDLQAFPQKLLKLKSYSKTRTAYTSDMVENNTLLNQIHTNGT